MTEVTAYESVDERIALQTLYPLRYVLSRSWQMRQVVSEP